MHRDGRDIARLIAALAPVPGRIEKAVRAAPGGEVAFWACASERAQAQAVAAEVERLIAREDVVPEDVCVLVRSVRAEGQAVAVALEERAVPYRLAGAATFAYAIGSWDLARRWAGGAQGTGPTAGAVR